MSGLPFLLEIGCEEIPDWMIAGALENLRGQFSALDLGTVTRVDATPRRLVLWAEGIPEKQADSVELVMGPAKSAGAGAAAGFARKMGVDVSALGVESTGKGEYFSFRKNVAGRRALDVLAGALPEILAKIPWPKTMYWTGKGGVRFIRPIRWMVALLGADTVPFELAGVKAGHVTRGHRRLGAAAIPVTIANYESELEKNFVIVSAARRRERIQRAIAGKGVKEDASLLDTLTYITEFPTAIEGSFDPAYLKLPKEVLVMVMRHHQKYFSVEAVDGSLAPRFIAVMNTDADPEGLVRHGNERVLRARFNDARFFWEVDMQRKLADRLEDLKKVTFQRDLGPEKGSYFAKTQRIAALVKELGGDAHAQRAALLSKCDLPAEMVKEFTDLQGIMGGLYAKAQGEPEEVWRAVYDHYKPLSMEDATPSTATGQLLALADKIDTLRGCFAIGLIPSGSKDPFALRRAAQGVVKILVEGKPGLGLEALCAGDAKLADFFADRVRYYFRDVRGFAYDEVNAAMARGWDDVIGLEARLERLRALRRSPDFEPLAASFKRIKNILEQAQFPGGPLKETLFEAGPERNLHAAFLATAGQPVEEWIGALRPVLDTFFDKVLVNAPDQAVRANRLALLKTIFDDLSKIADFSEIVTAGERS